MQKMLTGKNKQTLKLLPGLRSIKYVIWRISLLLNKEFSSEIGHIFNKTLNTTFKYGWGTYFK